jgi:uncharacterized protein YndB with AHSA1/START domain/ketosteroid isomerase-like protein
MAERSGGLRVEMEHLMPGARGRVFAFFADPAELAKWWGPHGFSTPSVEMDMRPGGTYRFAMQPPEGDLFHLAGKFIEVDPPARLVYTFRWEEPDPDDQETVVALSFVEAGARATKVLLTQGEFRTEERRALHEHGWADSFEKLRRLVSPSRLDIARACYDAYVTNDRRALDEHLSDDLVFFSPPDPGIGLETYFERCWPNSELIESFDFQRLVEVGDEVLVTYESTKTDGQRFRNTEVLTFDGDKVSRIEVYFGWNLP